MYGKNDSWNYKRIGIKRVNRQIDLALLFSNGSEREVRIWKN